MLYHLILVHCISGRYIAFLQQLCDESGFIITLQRNYQGLNRIKIFVAVISTQVAAEFKPLAKYRTKCWRGNKDSLIGKFFCLTSGFMIGLKYSTNWVVSFEMCLSRCNIYEMVMKFYWQTLLHSLGFPVTESKMHDESLSLVQNWVYLWQIIHSQGRQAQHRWISSSVFSLSFTQMIHDNKTLFTHPEIIAILDTHDHTH